MVEAQHIASTMKLVDDPEEQRILEELIEATKPAVPPECRHLHYLLFTPFRYAAYRHGSRFRRAGWTPGVFYASMAETTAVAELAFYRLLFFAESPDTPWPVDPPHFHAFETRYAVGRRLDLTLPPLSDGRAAWEHPTDYGACQALAETARAADVEAIVYCSVRDLAGGPNIALLTCRAFVEAEPTAMRSWRLKFGATGVQALREMPRDTLHFDRAAFAADPRLAGLRWTRP